MTKKLTRNEVHFNKIQSHITALKNKCASQGLLNSGAFYQQLCDLLLGGVKSYAKQEYDQVLNKVKSNALSGLNPKELVDLIDKNTKEIIQSHESLLKNELHTRGNVNSPVRILDQLNFMPQAEHMVNEMYNEFEASYSEYLLSKDNEQAQLDISRKSLEKAEEANRISRKNFWVTGIISSIALIVSGISVIISIYKK